MKTNRNNSQRSAFTLIEMVGVLAVIAILAALLVPKIFAAINDSRFSSSVASINSCKTATMGYFGKYGGFNGKLGAAMALADAPASAWDGVLVSEGLLEKPLEVKVGTSSKLYVDGLGTTNTYKIDGSTDIVGSRVVEIVIVGVDAADANEISTRIDGVGASTPTKGTTDTLGRVMWDSTSLVARVYLAHK